MGNEGTTLYLSAFIDELVRSGLKHIVISPGSRSTPIAVLAAEHADLKVWMHIDERSAAFFALGLAKSSRQPVALLCTSGTAAANYYPAIAEANLSRVPLIVLTADRPHELRDVGAPQTIDQLGMYGSHVKWFMEMPLPESAAPMLRHARMMAARAVITAGEAPAGVVHLNFPLREPLLPDLEHPQLFAAARREGDMAYTYDGQPAAGMSEAGLLQLAAELEGLPKGLIVVGAQNDPSMAAHIVQLAELLQYPIIADPLSGLRSGEHDKKTIIDSYDAFLRIESIAEELKPEVLLRFGAMPVSKPLLLYMNKHLQAKHIVIDEGGWRDPTLLAAARIVAHPAILCRQLLNALRPDEIARETLGKQDTQHAQDAELVDNIKCVDLADQVSHADHVDHVNLADHADDVDCVNLADHADNVNHVNLADHTGHANDADQVDRVRHGDHIHHADHARHMHRQPQWSSLSRQPSAWLARWKSLQGCAAEVLTAAAAADDNVLFEGAVVGQLQQLMDAQSTLFVGNSMPIRDVDSFWRNDEKSIHIMANRGANGIDGLVSTAIGISALQRGTVLLLGDLSLYHDLNGLLGAKLHKLDITIVVMNNDGGGIFSFLPQAQLPNHFETLFGTPIGLDYEHAAKLYGGSFERVCNWQQFQTAFKQAQASGGLHIIEVPTDRQINVELHRAIWPKLAERLAYLAADAE